MIEVKFIGAVLSDIHAEMRAFLGGEVLPVVATAPAEKKKPTGRKAVEEPTPAPVVVVEATPPPAPVLPTAAEIQEAVIAVNEKISLDKAIECLAKFGVKRARELQDNQKADFVAHCKSVLS